MGFPNPFSRDKLGLSGWDYLSLFNRREELFEKLSSRKLWAVVAGVALTTLGQQLNLSNDVIAHIVQLISVYIIGQGAVDVAKEVKKPK